MKLKYLSAVLGISALALTSGCREDRFYELANPAIEAQKQAELDALRARDSVYAKAEAISNDMARVNYIRTGVAYRIESDRSEEFVASKYKFK